MNLAEIMTRDVIVIAPDATLQEAAVKMREEDVGFLPVTDGLDIVGALTDRDLVVRGTAQGADPREMRVREVMSTDVVFVFEDQAVLEAVRLMEVRQIRRLVVLTRAQQLAGIVSIGDVATQAHDRALAGEALQQVSEPGHAHPQLH